MLPGLCVVATGRHSHNKTPDPLLCDSAKLRMAVHVSKGLSGIFGGSDGNALARTNRCLALLECREGRPAERTRHYRQACEFYREVGNAGRQANVPTRSSQAVMPRRLAGRGCRLSAAERPFTGSGKGMCGMGTTLGRRGNPVGSVTSRLGEVGNRQALAQFSPARLGYGIGAGPLTRRPHEAIGARPRPMTAPASLKAEMRRLFPAVRRHRGYGHDFQAEVKTPRGGEHRDGGSSDGVLGPDSLASDAGKAGRCCLRSKA